MLIKTNPFEIGELFAVANKEKVYLENEIKKSFILRDEQLKEKNKILADYTGFIDRLRDELYRDDVDEDVRLHNLKQIVQAENDNNLPF